MEQKEKDQTILTAYEDELPFDPSAPEKNLLAAVLSNALLDVQKTGQTHVEALEYLLSPDEEYVFSFRSICNHLEVDPAMVLKVVGLDTIYRFTEKKYQKQKVKGQ